MLAFDQRTDLQTSHLTCSKASQDICAVDTKLPACICKIELHLHDRPVRFPSCVILGRLRHLLALKIDTLHKDLRTDLRGEADINGGGIEGAGSDEKVVGVARRHLPCGTIVVAVLGRGSPIARILDSQAGLYCDEPSWACSQSRVAVAIGQGTNSHSIPSTCPGEAPGTMPVSFCHVAGVISRDLLYPRVLFVTWW